MSSGHLIVSIYNRLRKQGVDIARVEELGGWIFDTFKRGRVKLDGMTFEIPYDATTRRLRARFLTDAHEISERTLVKRYVTPDAQILELGGGFGIVACLANSMLDNPKAHIVVDPDPRSLATLKRNRDINKAGYQLYDGIISERHGQAMFFAPNAISSSLHMGQETERTPVNSLSIDQIQQETELKFDTYIVDIEGAELDFALENKKHLSQAKVIVMEFHPKRIGEDKCEQVRQILTECGLHRIEIVNDVEIWQRNH